MITDSQQISPLYSPTLSEVDIFSISKISKIFTAWLVFSISVFGRVATYWGSPSLLGIAEFIVSTDSFFHAQTHVSFHIIEELSPKVRMIPYWTIKNTLYPCKSLTVS